MTAIEWTDAVWNPIVGCSIVSPGCTHCYAMRMAARIEAIDEAAYWTRVRSALAGVEDTDAENRIRAEINNARVRSHYAGTTEISKAGAVWTGKVALAPDHILTAPLRWKKPRMVFVNSMGDLFHEDVPDHWIDRVFAVMALSPQHTFQCLTKRSDRMRDYCNAPEAPFRVAKAMDVLLGTGELGQEDVRPILGYPGYFASSHGFIYSEKRGKRRRMKPDVSEQGHMRVQLHREGKSSRNGDRLLVHRLILETFVGPPPATDAQGRHRDGNPQNNAVSNLSWGDQGENWSDSKRHGSHRRYSKLTEEQAAEIRRRHASGESAEALGREFGGSGTQIRNIATGKQWAVEPPIEWPLRQVWLGVSAERQTEADARIPDLLATPAATRFVSAEPLLSEIDFQIPHKTLPSGIRINLNTLTGEAGNGETTARLDWVIVGGESGPGARPMHPDWARSIRDQCQAADVPYFFKQWGEYIPGRLDGDEFLADEECVGPNLTWGADRGVVVCRDGLDYRRVGKSRAGRLLDGREWSEMPPASQHEQDPSACRASRPAPRSGVGTRHR